MIAFVVGTRPEALKLEPVWRHFSDAEVIAVRQHTDLLDAHLSRCPTRVVTVDRSDETLATLTSSIMHTVGRQLASFHPRLVVVQGDTATAVAGALAAFYLGIPVAHVEAGLRSYDIKAPFPEEANRKIISQVASYHFAPTERAADNLIREDVSGSIYITGNTSIDLLYEDLERVPKDARILLDPQIHKNLLLITCHRREGRDRRVLALREALPGLSAAGWSPVWIRHPAVPEGEVVPGAMFLNPVDHVSMMYLLQRATAVVTDSGGVIEEAVTLGVPTFILREETERQEAVDEKRAYLVDPDCLGWYLVHPEEWKRPEPCTIFGDGHAGERIADILKEAVS